MSNPAKRQEYDKKGILYVQDQNVVVSNYFFSVVILSPGCSHTLCCLPTISGLPEPEQGFNTHLQWPWHKVLGMVSMFRDATIRIHLQSWVVLRYHLVKKNMVRQYHFWGARDGQLEFILQQS